MIDSNLIILMMGVSAVFGILMILFVISKVKNGEFEDGKKMFEGVLYDSEDDLNEIIESEKNTKK